MVKGFDGLFIFALTLENKAFVVPGSGKLGVEFGSLVKCFDGLIVVLAIIALPSENCAFVEPGLCIFWFDLNRFIVSLYSLFILFLEKECIAQTQKCIVARPYAYDIIKYNFCFRIISNFKIFNA